MSGLNADIRSTFDIHNDIHMCKFSSILPFKRIQHCKQNGKKVQELQKIVIMLRCIIQKNNNFVKCSLNENANFGGLLEQKISTLVKQLEKNSQISSRSCEKSHKISYGKNKFCQIITKKIQMSCKKIKLMVNREKVINLNQVIVFCTY